MNSLLYFRLNFRWLTVAISLLIGIGSVLYTNMIVSDLADRERQQIELYAKTIEHTASVEANESTNFLRENILQENHSIPTVLVNEKGVPLEKNSLNIDYPEGYTHDEKIAYLKERVKVMKEEKNPIVMDLGANYGIEMKQEVYYESSFLIRQLQYYPYIQLSIIAIFSVLVYMIYSSSRTAEQNRVWVGLAKETAHQLGTPLSSLVAWIEYFKVDDTMDQEIVNDLEKDVKRLEMITSRFSNIGSVPSMTKEDTGIVVENIIGYLRKRVSKKVQITVNKDDSDLNAQINVPLFEWVIENVSKNAVDAMGGKGKIDIEMKSIGKNIQIDITDTGKGIPKKELYKFFKLVLPQKSVDGD